MAAGRTLQVRFLGDVRNLEKGTASITSRFGILAKGAAAAGAAVGAAALGIGKGLFEVGKTFDTVTDTIRVGTGATGKALKGLQNDAKAVGKNVPANFADIGTAVADLNTRLGLTGKPLQNMSSRFLNLSRITGTDLQGNIANVTRVFGDWGIKTADQAGAMDKLFRASQATGAGIDTLAQQVVQFGAPLRQMGFNFEQSLAIFGKFEKEGVNIETVMSGLRQGLGRMAKAGEAPAETFKRVTQEIKNAGSVGEANAIALETFGQRAGPDMAAAIREGRFELDELVNTITNGGDTINSAAKDTMSFAEQWQLFKNRVLIGLEPIASRVFGAVGGAMERLNSIGIPEKIVAGLDHLMAAGTRIAGVFNRELGPSVRDIVGVIQRNMPTIRKVASDAFDALVRGIELVAVGARKLINAMRSTARWIGENETPIKIVAGLIATLFIPHWIALGVTSTVNAAKVAAAWVVTQVSAVKAAVVHSAQIVKMVARFAFLGAQALIHAGKVAASWLIAMGPIGLAIAAVVALVAAVIANWDKVKKATVAAWKAVSGAVTAAWDWITGKFRQAAALVSNVWSVFWNGVRNTATTVWNAIRNFFGRALNGFLGFWTGMWTRIKDGFRTAFEGVKNIAANIWNGVGGLFRRGVNAVIRGVNWMIRQLNKIPGVNLGEIGLWAGPPVLRLAKGGPVVGPGTGTSDSIPARLSRGEHVWTAEEVRRAGGHRAVEELRRQVQGPLRTDLATGKRADPRDVRAGYTAPLFEDGSFGREGVHWDSPNVGIWRQMWSIVKRALPFARLTSAYRRHSSGYHGTGHAIDIAGDRHMNRGQMLSINRWIAQNYPNSTQLIHTPGVNLLNGRRHRYSAGTRADHFDHVHWAMANAAMLRGGGARGGFFSRVWNFLGNLSPLEWLNGLFQKVQSRIRDALPEGIGQFGNVGIGLLKQSWEGIKNWALDKIGFGGETPGSGPVRAQVRAVARRFGWGGGRQWSSLDRLIQKESSWNPRAQNPISTAYGLYQFLDSTWATVGGHKTSNPGLQAEFGNRYIRRRYGNPAAALAFHNRNNWYANGGIIDHPTLGMLGEDGPEAIVPLTKPGRARDVMDQAGIGGATYQLVVQGNVVAVDDVVEMVIRRFRLLESMHGV